jgi:hypothetical protein
MLMAELGTFIHGCEISAITLTWQLPPLSGWRERQGRAKFESLLKWNDVCASCGGKLSLPEGSIRHAGFRVGMKDVRIGDHLTRSLVSNNRGDIYNCDSSFTANFTKAYLCWGHSVGPFYFYFAHLYHRRCKASREETVLA